MTVTSRASVGYPVRSATLEDAPPIATIYNDAVATTVATFDTEPRSLEAQRAWLQQHRAPFTVLVVEDAGAVVGWASLSPWSDRKAYAGTAEVSVYVAGTHRGRGCGGALMDRLVGASDAAGFHTLIARVAEPNPASRRLHERRGFVSVGVMHEVGWKFDRWVDVRIFQRLLALPRVDGIPAPGPAQS